MTGGEADRILVAIDGSEESLRALRYAVGIKRRDERIKVHILNVQPALRRDVSMLLPTKNIRDFHLEEGEKALAAARLLLDESGVPYEFHISVGSPGEVIAAFAAELGAAQIVMSTRGHGRASAAVLGSVAVDTLRNASVPVTFVK